MSFLTVRSPNVISTPGGIDIGVRPSLEGLLDVLENWRRGDEAWKAGTRKPGSVTALPEIAFSRTLLRPGASIVAIVNWGRLDERYK